MCEPLRSFVVAASVHCQPFFVTASCSDLVWLTICIRAERLCATVTSIRALPVAVILNRGGEGRGVV